MPRRAAIVIAASIIVPILLWIGFDLLIESDEERIEAMAHAMAAAIEAEDVQAILADVSADYLHEGLTRDDLGLMAQAYFKTFGATTLIVRGVETNVTGAAAVANVSVHWRSERGQVYAGGMPTRWQLTLLKRRDAWRITEITPVSIGRYETGGWGRIAGRLGVTPSGR